MRPYSESMAVAAGKVTAGQSAARGVALGIEGLDLGQGLVGFETADAALAHVRDE